MRNTSWGTPICGSKFHELGSLEGYMAAWGSCVFRKAEWDLQGEGKRGLLLAEEACQGFLQSHRSYSPSYEWSHLGARLTHISTMK